MDHASKLQLLRKRIKKQTERIIVDEKKREAELEAKTQQSTDLPKLSTRVMVGTIYEPANITNLHSHYKLAKKVFELRSNIKKLMKLSVEDIYIIKTLSEGKYSKVVLVALIGNMDLFAMKVIYKEKVTQTIKERLEHEEYIMSAVRFPFTQHLQGRSEDKNHIYFLLPLLAGGDFFITIRRLNELKVISCRIEAVNFYSAQLLLALEYLHNMGVCFRDLRPESIMMDHKGYIKLTSFGLCKIINNERTYTFCGTAEYQAPEILKQEGYGYAVDWWGLGIIIFEMLFAITPFYSSSLSLTYDRIINDNFVVPYGTTRITENLMAKLLTKDPTKRLGNLKGGTDDIKQHEFFKYITWTALVNQIVPPPFVPGEKFLVIPATFPDYVKQGGDFSNINNYQSSWEGF